MQARHQGGGQRGIEDEDRRAIAQVGVGKPARIEVPFRQAGTEVLGELDMLAHVIAAGQRGMGEQGQESHTSHQQESAAQQEGRLPAPGTCCDQGTCFAAESSTRATTMAALKPLATRAHQTRPASRESPWMIMWASGSTPLDSSSRRRW